MYRGRGRERGLRREVLRVLTRWRSVGERGRRDSSVASESMVRLVVDDDDDVALLV